MCVCYVAGWLSSHLAASPPQPPSQFPPHLPNANSPPAQTPLCTAAVHGLCTAPVYCPCVLPLYCLQDEVFLNGSIVLPHKDIKESIMEPGTIIM